LDPELHQENCMRSFCLNCVFFVAICGFCVTAGLLVWRAIVQRRGGFLGGGIFLDTRGC
jgi:hypothetical protein